MPDTSEPDGPSYSERVVLFERLPASFTIEQLVEVGASLGFEAYKTFSCLRAYQFAELVVQNNARYIKLGDSWTA